jgi:hypothetical protein
MARVAMRVKCTPTIPMLDTTLQDLEMRLFRHRLSQKLVGM